MLYLQSFQKEKYLKFQAPKGFRREIRLLFKVALYYIPYAHMDPHLNSIHVLPSAITSYHSYEPKDRQKIENSPNF